MSSEAPPISSEAPAEQAEASSAPAVEERQFHQITPREREECVSCWSKETLEKYRINNRRESHARFEPPKHPLEQVPALNPGLATNHEVFQTGACQQLQEQHLAERSRYKVRHPVQPPALRCSNTQPLLCISRCSRGGCRRRCTFFRALCGPELLGCWCSPR